MELDLQTILILLFLLTCVLPLIVFAVIAFFLFRWGRRGLRELTSADIAQMQQRLQDLRQRYPHATTDELVHKVIHREALKCGVVGAVTGIGGFYTLPIALPVDMVVSLRIQASLVNFIAQAYNAGNNPVELQARSYLVTTGSAQITQSSTQAATRLLVRIIGKSFSKLIPIISLFISFGVNYAIVQVMGRAAIRWYKSGGHSVEQKFLTR